MKKKKHFFLRKMCGRRNASTEVNGFSLVELMVVVAVVGVIAALAIPNLASISSQAKYAKAQRNAQILASMAATARAAGYTNDWDSVGNAIGLLTTNVGEGLIVGGKFSFGVSSLSERDVTEAMQFLQISVGASPDTLIYTNSN
jgi:prepilin-type N-terminal cleavage/methylation domain-containing protein